MTKLTYIITTILFFLAPLHALAADTDYIIPGLKGFGVDTRAAYGPTDTSPTICIVDDLDPDSAIADDTRNGVAVKTGGLRSFINWDVDNKLIIFEVSGYIDYKGEINIDNDYVTIAGQTAPSPGVTLRYTSLKIDNVANDFLLWHLRVRTGDDAVGVGYDNRNCIEVYGDEGVIDHCSFSWSTDSMYGSNGTNNITISNNIFFEPLDDPHSKPAHSTAVNFTWGADNIILRDNLIGSSRYRNPNLSAQSTGQDIIVSNNLIYNPVDSNIFLEEATGVSNYAIDGNSIIGGPSSGQYADTVLGTYRDQNAATDVYIVDTRIETYEGAVNTQDDSNDWDTVRMASAENEGENKNLTTPIVYPTGYVAYSSVDVEATVSLNVGARPNERDAVDTRAIAEVAGKTGSLKGDMTDVGGFPALEEVWRSVEDINFPSNPHGLSAGAGSYTNLEVWLHNLANLVEDGTPLPGSEPWGGVSISKKQD